MKKLFFAALIACLGMANVYADAIPLTPNKLAAMNHFEVWKINQYSSRGYWNLFEDKVVRTRFLVNRYDSQNMLNDRVTLTCNGQPAYLTPGQWKYCTILPYQKGMLSVSPWNANHGAEVYVELLDY